MTLPEAFIEQTRAVMGDDRFARFLAAFDEEPPVSIRLNPMKTKVDEQLSGEAVPWCPLGTYLPSRPNFTFDPLFHAGCYYVQEAASMFLYEVLCQQIVNSKLSNSKCLDLCAAPGGKSTLLRSLLPDDCVLYSNEPVRQRASILLENITKWGHPNSIVTNNYPRDYRKSGLTFDLILCDVPCSGEGMFRRDPATIAEWSPQNVERCWQLQRDIVSDAWQCLRPGGLLIYSTCTFNTKENEENIRWMLEQYADARVLPVVTQPEWHITGSLLEGFSQPVYRFIPGITRSEGLFVCVLRKEGQALAANEVSNHAQGRKQNKKQAESQLKILSVPLPDKERSAKSTAENNISIPLTYPQAIAYLRGEALVLPADAPRGLLTVDFMGHPLGLVKNIGTRANNLYPKEWRIKSTYIPKEYEAILRHT